MKKTITIKHQSEVTRYVAKIKYKVVRNEYGTTYHKIGVKLVDILETIPF